MGCDGGTIPKRDELVRTKKKPEQVSINIFLLTSQCEITFFSIFTERQAIRTVIQMGTLFYNARTITNSNRCMSAGKVIQQDSRD